MPYTPGPTPWVNDALGLFVQSVRDTYMNKRKYRRLCNPTYEPHGEEGFGAREGDATKDVRID